MKQMEAPKCRLCEKNHWAREGCDGMLQERVAMQARPLPAHVDRALTATEKSTRKAPADKPSAPAVKPHAGKLAPKSKPAKKRKKTRAKARITKPTTGATT